MATKISEEFKTDLNGKYNDAINKTIKRELGVDVNMVANDNGRMEDTIKTDVDKKMRGNKILRSLFKSAYLYGYAYEYDEDNCIGIWLNVGYNHYGGGSNGHDLITIYIDKDTCKVRSIRR